MTARVILCCFFSAVVCAEDHSPTPPEGGFIDTHVHAHPCSKDGLDVVDAWMKRMNVTQCIIHPLNHKA